MKLTKVVKDNYIDKIRKYNYKGMNIIVIPDVNNKPWFRAKDIGCILEYGNTRDAIKKHIEHNNKIHFRKFSLLSTEKQKIHATKITFNTVMLNKKGLRQLLMGSRKLLATETAKIFGFDPKFFFRYRQKEIEIFGNLKIFFDELNIKYVHQYLVDKYKIDIYLPHHKLAIEIDEHDHMDRNKTTEKEREVYIKKKLNCQFLRCNPDSKTFSIPALIGQITKRIYNQTQKYQ